MPVGLHINEGFAEFGLDAWMRGDLTPLRSLQLLNQVEGGLVGLSASGFASSLSSTGFER